jgi:hypothetical protein
MIASASGVAMAQESSKGVAAQLPDIKGTVAQYTLTPRGDVDGLILADGTEVILPPRDSTRLVFAVRPGDAITVRGTKAGDSAAINAVAVVNDTTGFLVGNGAFSMRQHLDDQSTIKLQLHGRKGELNGVLLGDGAIVRMPPQDAAQNVSLLTVGNSFYVRGEGEVGPLGKVIAAHEIGPNKTQLTEIADSRFQGWIHDIFGGDDDSKSSPADPAKTE